MCMSSRGGTVATDVMSTPSMRRLPEAAAAFDSNENMEDLLVAPTVGDRRLARALLKYRSCSRRMKAAVDSAVAQWCAQFQLLQHEHVWHVHARLQSGKGERVYEVEAQLDEMATRAFGKTQASKAFVHISHATPAAYFACLRGVCMLCGARLSKMASFDDSERPAVAPCYVIAHDQCQRKHMVAVPVCRKRAGPIPGVVTGNGGLDTPQAELAAVSAFLGVPPAITRASVLPRLSAWYRSRVPDAQRRSNAPILVWLRVHPLVRAKDTLYGALGITPEDVQGALQQRARHLQEYKEDMEKRRRLLAHKTEKLSNIHESKLRLWLSEGRTRWCTVEHLEACHEDMLSSTMATRLLCPTFSSRRHLNLSVATVCNSLLLLSRALDLVEKPLSRAVFDWLVGCATVSCLFGESSHELQFVDASRIAEAVHNEARVAAITLDTIENMRGHNVRCARARRIAAGDLSREEWFAFAIEFSIGAIDAKTVVRMTRADACKLKFKAAAAAPSLSGLPLVPGEHAEEQELLFAAYFNRLLGACLLPEAGMARSVILRQILPTDQRLILEIASACRFASGIPALLSECESGDD